MAGRATSSCGVSVPFVSYPESLEIDGVPFERWDARREMPALHALADDEAVRRFLRVPSDEAGLAAMSERFAEHWQTHGSASGQCARLTASERAGSAPATRDGTPSSPTA